MTPMEELERLEQDDYAYSSVIDGSAHERATRSIAVGRCRAQLDPFPWIVQGSRGLPVPIRAWLPATVDLLMNSPFKE
jgi:hypothetical protein